MIIAAKIRLYPPLSGLRELPYQADNTRLLCKSSAETGKKLLTSQPEPTRSDQFRISRAIMASRNKTKNNQNMEEIYREDETYDKIDFKSNPLTKGEYENCSFINCDFSNSDLSDYKFADCEFSECNLSLIKLTKTAFRDIKFVNCKMLGLQFDNCREIGLSFSFENCILNHSSFYRLKIKKTAFINTQLHEVDFSECDLTNSHFDNCDLSGAIFDKTVIAKADFSTSYNYSIDPEINSIRKAKFSVNGLWGLLRKYDIEITDIQ
jgi:fluoroquinolone resistance protein